jgi:hypothetical protein
MFIAALFTIVKIWTQPRCLTTDKCIKKMWYLYTMEFYSVTKKNKILSFEGKWMELEIIILRDVSQAHKAKNRRFSLICALFFFLYKVIFLHVTQSNWKLFACPSILNSKFKEHNIIALSILSSA